METISNPSPANFLKRSPLLKPVSDIPKSKPVKPRGTAAPKSSSKTALTNTATQETAVTKPKQSKSRNGTHERSTPRSLLMIVSRLHDMQKEEIEV